MLKYKREEYIEPMSGYIIDKVYVNTVKPSDDYNEFQKRVQSYPLFSDDEKRYWNILSRFRDLVPVSMIEEAVWVMKKFKALSIPVVLSIDYAKALLYALAVAKNEYLVAENIAFSQCTDGPCFISRRKFSKRFMKHLSVIQRGLQRLGYKVSRVDIYEAVRRYLDTQDHIPSDIKNYILNLLKDNRIRKILSTKRLIVVISTLIIVSAKRLGYDPRVFEDMFAKKYSLSLSNINYVVRRIEDIINS